MTDLAARLGFEVPHHATDCHMHIFGDPVRFPPAAQRAYDPTPMELDLYNAEAARMGFSRVVFVQASAYGTDNACMMQALRARPGHGQSWACRLGHGLAAYRPAYPRCGQDGHLYAA